MYKVRFNTTNFQSKNNRRDWENQLKNDFAVAINGKEFECETELDLDNRLSFIMGGCYDRQKNNDDDMKVWDQYEHDENNYFELENERYNTQRLKYGMYRFALGYINKDKIIEEVNNKGFKSIPFNNFYDLRQGNFFKGCFIEIIKEVF